MSKNIWFTSDTHYGHKNIVRGTSNWENKDNGQRVRDFNTLEEHNSVLVDNFNSVVKENDEVWHLGDWSFGGYRNIWEFRKRLKCRNIHLVYGNHDEHIVNNKILDEDQEIEAHDWLLKDAINRYYVRMQNLFSSVQYYKELNINNRNGKSTFILSHYAMRVWNRSHHGSIMLYGHSHGTLDELTPNIANPTWIGDQYFIKNYRTMDVGVDTNNLYPYHLDQIYYIMEDREVSLEVDHHNSKTT